ncbi:hypothetical protein V5799_021967, partial [Amblyomma americanum]
MSSRCTNRQIRAAFRWSTGGPVGKAAAEQRDELEEFVAKVARVNSCSTKQRLICLRNKHDFAVRTSVLGADVPSRTTIHIFLNPVLETGVDVYAAN